MIEDPRQIRPYDPNAKAHYLVGPIDRNAKRQIIVTEIRRPEPEAVLHLRTGETVELTNEEIRILLHLEDGPLIPRDLLTLVAPPAPAVVETAQPVEAAAAPAPAKKAK